MPLLYNQSVQPFRLNDDGSSQPPLARQAWVRDQIRHFNRKLEPRFRARKFSLLSQSPLHFFRGTNHLFWFDFGGCDLINTFGGGKGTRIWICGDLHCDNLGSFTDSTGRLVYDLNDFDESVIADFQMDLWRLATSLVLACRENKKNSRNAARLAESCAKGYWRELKSCRWYENVRYGPWDEEQASSSLRHFLSHTKKHQGFPAMLDRWTKAGKGGLRFKVQGNPDLEPLPIESVKKIEKALLAYAHELKHWPMEKPRMFEIQDITRRLNSGVGSEGLHRYYALIRVKDNGADPYRILDIKRQLTPSPWEYLPKTARRKTREFCGDSQSLRVDLASRALSRHTDPWLGRLDLKDEEFSVRERSPYRAHMPPGLLDEDASYQLGAILARAHCRTRDSFAKKAFESIKGDKSRFRMQTVAIALGYADQVLLDYQGFRENNKRSTQGP